LLYSMPYFVYHQLFTFLPLLDQWNTQILFQW
jgi:hypothetical protein